VRNTTTNRKEDSQCSGRRKNPGLPQIQRRICLYLLSFTCLHIQAYGGVRTAYTALDNNTTEHFSAHSPLIQITTKILLSTLPQNVALSQCLQLLIEEERFRIPWQWAHFSLQDSTLCHFDLIVGRKLQSTEGGGGLAYTSVESNTSEVNPATYTRTYQLEIKTPAGHRDSLLRVYFP
jgi:hypothetical protein